MKKKRANRAPVGRLSDRQVRRIRAVFDARLELPTDNQLAAENGISAAMVRKVGQRVYYVHVSDDH